jgi:hypothetical protein
VKYIDNIQCLEKERYMLPKFKKMIRYTAELVKQNCPRPELSIYGAKVG